MWTAFLSVPLSAACAVLGGGTTACDGLVYKEFGLTREEYLPCAGEMIATLDRLKPQIDAMLSGDKNARGESLETLRELERLMKKAGGRNLDVEWKDRGLTSLNHRISNTHNQYWSCLMYGNLGGQCTYPAQLGREAKDAYRYLMAHAPQSPGR